MLEAVNKMNDIALILGKVAQSKLDSSLRGRAVVDGNKNGLSHVGFTPRAAVSELEK